MTATGPRRQGITRPIPPPPIARPAPATAARIVGAAPDPDSGDDGDNDRGRGHDNDGGDDNSRGNGKKNGVGSIPIACAEDGVTGSVPRPGRADGQHRPVREPSFPAETLRVTTLADPVLDRLGHDPRSTYVERFWLPILGPSCLLLLRRLAAELEQQPEGFTLTTAQWAREMGVGMKGGRNGPLWRAVERGCRFGAAQRNGELLAVRRRLPPLTARQIDRLPAELQDAHVQWVAARQKQPKRPTVTKWSPRRDQIARPLPATATGSTETEDLPTTARLDDAA